jgi:hypothetical protein
MRLPKHVTVTIPYSTSIKVVCYQPWHLRGQQAGVAGDDGAGGRRRALRAGRDAQHHRALRQRLRGLSNQYESLYVLLLMVMLCETCCPAGAGLSSQYASPAHAKAFSMLLG